MFADQNRRLPPFTSFLRVKMSQSSQPLLGKSSKIIIVGAGVFGLSTALHLSRCGYSNVDVYDKQPHDQNNYANSEGADAASADENKILRASYGDARLYQDLAFKAMPEWDHWNRVLAETPDDDLPPSLNPTVKLWDNCGFLRLSGNGLEKSEVLTQRNFPTELAHTQYRVIDPQRRSDAQASGIPFSKIDPFDRLERKLPTDGILDTTAGYVLASRACTFALRLCKLAGVHFHLGEPHALKSIMYDTDQTRATGILTAAGERHVADLLIIACGGWTPSLLPTRVSQLLETTSGSVLSIRIPHDRPDLRERFSPANFPVWSWNMGSYERTGEDVGGIYGLPRTPEGVVKIAFRGAKWTNYTFTDPESGETLSYPKTDVDEVPEEAMRVLRAFTAENMPELLDLELEKGRLCWYTDSVDNNFLIDRVPGVENVIVASGGSGHGFKFLPVLGEHVVDVVEGKDTSYTRMFAWRDVPTGRSNGLEEGPEGWRVLGKQRMVGKRAWKRGSAL